MKKQTYLEGQLLIAMPGMADTRFDRSVICMCVHSESGAMGLIVNKVMPMMNFGDLVARLEILEAGGPKALPDDLMSMAVQYGGPVEQGRGFVLHTADYFIPETSLRVNGRIALTATLDILRAMAMGQGPQRAMLALGYSGWAPGQLEDEIQRNGWLNCEADEELLFSSAHEEKYSRALARIGIDPAMLSSESGHA
jgi:putative transcriptional regulator